MTVKLLGFLFWLMKFLLLTITIMEITAVITEGEVVLLSPTTIATIFFIALVVGGNLLGWWVREDYPYYSNFVILFILAATFFLVLQPFNPIENKTLFLRGLMIVGVLYIFSQVAFYLLAAKIENDSWRGGGGSIGSW